MLAEQKPVVAPEYDDGFVREPPLLEAGQKFADAVVDPRNRSEVRGGHAADSVFAERPVACGVVRVVGGKPGNACERGRDVETRRCDVLR